MTQLIVSYIVGNCEKYIDMSLNSIIDVADKIVIVYDTTSKDRTKEKLEGWKENYPDKFIIIDRPYEHDLSVKNANSNARNVYLDYLKGHFDGDWCLVLDADEVCDERVKNIKDLMIIKKNYLISPQMIHFIQDLAHEDATQPIHFVPNRFFRIHKELKYPDGEHPVLESSHPEAVYDKSTGFIIYHLAYILPLFETRDKYIKHLNKSKIHSPLFLKQWYFWHMFGGYPKKDFDINKIPPIILEWFNIDKDEIYFMNRGLEMKHHLMVKSWYDYFKPKSVLDLGCGRGSYLYYWTWFVGDLIGIELSEWAVKNSFIPGKVIQGNIVTDKILREFDLITFIDVLEHLSYKDLDIVLEKYSKFGKNFLFSIPYKGTQNLEADPTHIIKEDKEWWMEKIQSFGIKIKETPKEWLFANQILIGERIK